MVKSPCRVFANVDGADHCQFEHQGAAALFACKLIEGAMGCKPTMSPAAQQSLSAKYTLLFADYVAKGDQSSLQSLMDGLGSDSGISSFEHVGCATDVTV